MEIDLKLCNFAAEKASLLGACPQQGVGMKVKNKPWHSLNYTPEVPFMIWCSDKYKQKYPAIINNIKKALHRSFRTDEICNVVFHISQLNTPYYRDKYDLLSPSFVPLDSVSQSMYN